jgi:hypothetical protein
MVPTAEERFDATLSNGGVADHWLGIAAIDSAYRDGHAAGFADALEMAAQRVEWICDPNTDDPVADRCDDAFNKGAHRDVASRLISWGNAVAAAIRSLATAPTGEKKE